MRGILFLAFLLLPLVGNGASLTFLTPRVDKVQREVVCPDPRSPTVCRAILFVKGKRFLNSNGRGSLRVGDFVADVMKWTDTLIVASVPVDKAEGTIQVDVTTDLMRPTLATGNVVLDEIFTRSVDLAISSVHVDASGDRYFVAGPKYRNPERVYYRDSYWTSGMILMIEPSIVLDQILLLARGVDIYGSVPSAIPVDSTKAMIPLWIDHVDSGPYFIMMVEDYISWTGDKLVLDRKIGARTLFSILQDIQAHLSWMDKDGDRLPEKAVGSTQDWLDEIPRGGEVLSNEVLYYQSLVDLTELASLQKQEVVGSAYRRLANSVRFQINRQFWNEEKGYYNEYCEEDVCNDRLTNESSLAALFNVVSARNRPRLFSALRTLETNRNSAQPYGDWGVLNAWPLYEGKKIYSYQNGTDWPFLDGINAGARLLYSNTDWYYPMTRWWTYSHDVLGWDRLPEFVSPVDQVPGFDQSWSVAPAVSLIRYGLGINPRIDANFEAHRPIWGRTVVTDLFIRGRRFTKEF